MLLHFLWNLIAFIIALGILITVHECGHFLAARFFGVQIERFSIGFGPVLWKWRDSNNTEYVISIIFFGGYVKLFNTQAHHIAHRFDVNNAFNHKSIWKKILILLAGPVFNFIFSILLYTLVYVIGIPINKPIIHTIIPNSIIANVGIFPGMEIKSVNNIHTHDWETVRFQILNNIEKEKIIISATSINNTNLNTYIIHVPKHWFNTFTNIKDPILALGILPYNTKIIPIISDIQSNSAAERGGLKIGDKILSIDDQPMHDWNSFITNVKNNPEKIFKISVERRHKILYFYITPDKKYLINSNIIEGSIGIFPKIITVFPKEQHCTFYKYQLHNAILQACIKTWDLIYLISNTLIKLISGNVKMVNIGGPVSIAQGAGESAHFGLIYYLMFLSVISINLGIINLLPFPILDGGYLFFLILEKIGGKFISQRIKDFGYIIGFFALTLIMCFAIFNDVSRLW